MGATASLYFPIRAAFQPKPGGISDVFITKLNSDGTRILFSSYLGGGRPASSSSLTEGQDSGSGIALGFDGRVYLAGRTLSTNFPITPGAFQTNAGGGDCFLGFEPCGDAFVARIDPNGPGSVPTPHLEVTPTEVALGGIVTATWAGIASPTSDDRLILFQLGERSDSFIFLPTYDTRGTAAGTLPLSLPDTITPGSYELRLLTPDPGTPALLTTVARSEPLTIVKSISLVPRLGPGNIFRVRVNGLPPGIYHVEATETHEPPDRRVIASVEAEAGQPAEFSEKVDFTRPRRFYRVSL